MAIYADFGKIQGAVTAKGYENHIEWDHFGFAANRNISMKVGAGSERESDKPDVGQFTLGKKMDKASKRRLAEQLLAEAREAAAE